jgi:RNase adapter protein RapZ
LEANASRLVILTGMSGAGKSTALRTFEDLGYYCIDNLPPSLIETFLQLHAQAAAAPRGIAIVCDVRAGELFAHFAEAVGKLTASGFAPELVYFDCDQDVLVSRFTEARRLPPLASGMRIEEALDIERAMLEPLKGLATQVIDTTTMATRQLRERLLGLFGVGTADGGVSLTVLSFGFKYGIPMDADFVFDTRFLPNPFYVDALRALSGHDEPVKDYVLGNELARQYLSSVFSLLQFTLPHYADVHKHYAVLAIGCTGGRHRSVVLANELCARLRNGGARVIAQHRDVDRD